MPAHSLVGAPRRVRNVHGDNIIGANYLSTITRVVHPNVGARRVSSLYVRCYGSRGTVPTYLGCRNCPGDMYASVGRIMYRNVPGRRSILRRNSVIGISVAAVISNCCTSTDHVFVINNGAAPRGRRLIHITGRYLRVNVRTTGPCSFINSVNRTVRGRYGGCNCNIIHSLYNRKMNYRFRRRPRILRCNREKANVLLIPNVIFAVRPVVGVKA